MSYINSIKKALLEFSDISDYLITETGTKTYEMFYDIHKLETLRTTSTLEAVVTIYKEINEEDNKYLASASFTVPHKLTKSELKGKIDDTLYALSFAKSKYYELPNGYKSKTASEHLLSGEPFEILETIAHEFTSSNDAEVKFNSLELFLNSVTLHIVNSKGVNYKSKRAFVKVEAIPSFKNDSIQTELYRMFTYDKLDLAKVKEDVQTSIADVKDRAKATKIEEPKTINVILREDDAKELFYSLIDNFDYSDVYDGSSLKQIGEEYQNSPICPLTIKVGANSKAQFFDQDGVVIKETTVLENGTLVNNYGSNRFAYYLGKAPSGVPSKITVNGGKRKVSDFKKNPYLEIIALSGIQIDVYSGYIGGEIRLAKYFDGEKEVALSGLSFSGNLNTAINQFELSKEMIDKNGYHGPKYVLLKDMSVM